MTIASTPSRFVLALPKAELHLHLEGTVSPETLSTLSARHTAPLPVENNRYHPDPASGEFLDVSTIQRLYSYEDFTGFMLAFKSVTERLRAPEDYELVTYEMMRQLAAENVLHAEVFVSVGVVQWRGQDFLPLFEGMEAGRTAGEREFGVSVAWIFDSVRHFPVEEAEEVVKKAVELHPRNVVGVGIGGDERRGAAQQFRSIYRYASENGLHLSAHAGETVGPESIWAALNIGAERLGHGLHAERDAELMDVLAQRQLPIEVCISSNVRTGCCRRLDEHPVRRMFDAGLMVTLNSDDPAMFQTSLAREYQLAQEVFGFTNDQLRELARNSFEASWLPPDKKLELLEKIDKFNL